MQIANQTFYITIFVILIGLMGVFLSKHDEYRLKKTNKFWPWSLGLFALSALSFFLVPWTSNSLLIVANISLIWGGIYLSILFKTWHSRLSRNIYKLIFVFGLVVSAVYVNLLLTSTTVTRIYFVNSVLMLLSIWQIYELIQAYKKGAEIQIKYLIVVECLQIAVRSGRSLDVYLNVSSELTSIYHEGLLGFSLRVASIILIVLACVLVTNYYLEKLLGTYKSSSAAMEEGLLVSLNALSKARDNETGNHILRTREYVRILGLCLLKMDAYKGQFSRKDVDLFARSSPLHDIGKVGIPDHILQKPGQLTDDEWELMKTHAELGESVLRQAKSEDIKHSKLLDVAIQIAGGHHEQWDGSGYPRGLKGEQIPLAARLMSVADCYDALVSDRVYKKRWSFQEAYQEIVDNRAKRFDPLVVDAFIASHEEFKIISERYKDA